MAAFSRSEHRSLFLTGVRAVDLRGRYVVPGLIDAHAYSIGRIAQMHAALESGV